MGPRMTYKGLGMTQACHFLTTFKSKWGVFSNWNFYFLGGKKREGRIFTHVLRDVDELGRDMDLVLHQYIQFVKPAFEEFCIPTKKFADVIIPRGPDNK